MAVCTLKAVLNPVLATDWMGRSLTGRVWGPGRVVFFCQATRPPRPVACQHAAAAGATWKSVQLPVLCFTRGCDIGRSSLFRPLVGPQHELRLARDVVFCLPPCVFILFPSTKRIGHGTVS